MRDHTLLCVVAFLVPLAGIVAGIYGITRETIAWRNTGRAMLICATASVVLVGVAYFLFAAIFVRSAFRGVETPDLGFPGLSPAKVDVAAIEWYPSYQLGSEYFVYRPDSGKKYVVMTITVTNRDKERVYVSADDFELTCDNKNVYSSTDFLSSEGINLISADLLPGGSATGQVVFEVDEVAKPVSVDYSPSLF
jgi:hypothetical protein